MLVLRRVMVASALDRDGQRGAGVRRVRTDANRDRTDAVGLDHPARRDEDARRQRQQHGQQEQDAGTAKGGEDAHGAGLMVQGAAAQADRMSYGIRHCERSEAIQSGLRTLWIAASPSAPRNDEGLFSRRLVGLFPRACTSSEENT